MSVLSSVLRPVLQPVLGSVLDSSVGGPPRFRGLDLDFSKGRYSLNGPYQPTFPAGWSFSRTGAGTAQRVDGALVPFASGVPRITDLGLLGEEQRTNKVIIRNATPDTTAGINKAGDVNSVLSVVTDFTSIINAGLSGVVTNGNVFRLDNRAGTGNALALVMGVAGNTNPHSASCYLRGSGLVRVRTGVQDTSFYTLTGMFSRISRTIAAPNSGSGLEIWASAGADVYFIIPQWEEGSFSTSPIVTEGSAATRGADSASIIVPSGVSSFTAYYGPGQTASGAVTPGQTFDISASNRPWFNGYLQRLVMQ